MSCDIEATMFYYKARDGVLPAINDIELLSETKMQMDVRSWFEIFAARNAIILPTRIGFKL